MIRSSKKSCQLLTLVYLLIIFFKNLQIFARIPRFVNINVTITLPLNGCYNVLMMQMTKCLWPYNCGIFLIYHLNVTVTLPLNWCYNVCWCKWPITFVTVQLRLNKDFPEYCWRKFSSKCGILLSLKKDVTIFCKWASICGVKIDFIKTSRLVVDRNCMRPFLTVKKKLQRFAYRNHQIDVQTIIPLNIR